MTFSALDTLLAAKPSCVGGVLDAIERGEVSVAKSIEASPHLLVNFLREASQSGRERETPTQRQAQTRMIELLLAHGADPWVEDYRGKDGFYWAVILGNSAVVDMLARAPGAPADLNERTEGRDGTSVIFQACNNTPMLRTLIGLGFDKHATRNSRTLLHETQSPEAAAFLLAQNLDPAAKTDQGLDVQAYWDKMGFTAPHRSKMDLALRGYLPQEPEKLVQGFAVACLEVGVPAAKQRLVAAGIDPGVAGHAGFSLPELLAIEGLRRGLKSKGHHSLGNEMGHKHWRKLVFSAVRHCQMDKASEEQKRQLRDVVELMEMADQHLRFEHRAKTLPSSRSLKSKNPAAPKDTSSNDLRSAVGLGPRNTTVALAAETIDRWATLLDRMVDARLVDNGSLLATWILQYSFYSWDAYANHAQSGEALFLRLAKQATRSDFDPNWEGPQSLAKNMYSMPLSLQRIPLPIPERLAKLPNGIGVMGSLIGTISEDRAPLQWMSARLKEHETSGDLKISMQDPWLASAVEVMKESKYPQKVELSQRLRVLAEQQDLQATTTPSHLAKRGPRL